MRGEELGRRSLQLDAVYCAAVGAAIAGLRRPVGRILGVPPEATVASGIATVAWSGAVAAMSRRAQRRWPVAAVGTANTAAALALLIAGTRRRHPVARTVLVVGGLQVAGFAVSQALALLPADAKDLVA